MMSSTPLLLLLLTIITISQTFAENSKETLSWSTTSSPKNCGDNGVKEDDHVRVTIKMEETGTGIIVYDDSGLGKCFLLDKHIRVAKVFWYC